MLDVLGPRAKTEPAGAGPAGPAATGRATSQHPWHRGPAEATALAALAFARGRPQAAGARRRRRLAAGPPPGDRLAAAQGQGARPRRPGRAIYGRAQAAEDRYRLVVTVNDTEVYRAEVVGPAEGKAIRVPRKALKPGDKNRVRFDIEGRGTFGYAVTLTGFTRDFGPDQDRANRPFVIDRRVYLPADPELDGKVLPTGFGVAVNAQDFENTVTQVPLDLEVAMAPGPAQRPGDPAP